MMGNALAVTDPEAGMVTWQVMKEQCGMLVKTGFLPKSVDTAEKALAIALQARELGIPMMAGFRLIAVIQGKPTISSEGMLALCQSRIQGFRFKVVSEDANHCTIWMARPSGEYAGTYTMAEAKAAGLHGKENWSKYPAAMLRARAISLTARVLAPDVILGVYTPDELGAITNEDGEVTALPPESVDAELVQEKPQPAIPACADCGLEIGAGAVKGKQLTAAQFAAGSLKHFGRPLCAECAESAEVKDTPQVEPEPADETAALRAEVARLISALPITKQSMFLRENAAAQDLPHCSHDQLLALQEALKAL
jgi:hypothetical protein